MVGLEEDTTNDRVSSPGVQKQFDPKRQRNSLRSSGCKLEAIVYKIQIGRAKRSAKNKLTLWT